MITNELKDLVREEARNLREKATKEELGKLNFEDLDPEHVDRCIYGQATGSCYSKRATSLIESCCSKVVIETEFCLTEITVGFDADPILEDRSRYWSPIEVYIVKPDAKNSNLIAYLKGETDILEL